ncbi:MAG: hypothetical protein QOE14_2333, partial [Humisphaera sp.]|nr:hypothetical protein [Humisphaera sp.]
CLVCGRNNPHGLNMSLFVDPESGIVHVDFSPRGVHIGFEGIVHGGMLATVIDEAMVWAATWAGKRFCVCGELAVRYRRPAQIGEPLHLEARVEFARPKLIQTMATVRSTDNNVVCAGEGKYVPMDREQSQRVVQSFLDEDATREAASMLARGV